MISDLPSGVWENRRDKDNIWFVMFDSMGLTRSLLVASCAKTLDNFVARCLFSIRKTKCDSRSATSTSEFSDRSFGNR